MEIVSIGVQGLSGDEAKEEKYFKFAKAAGAKYMSIDFNINKMPQCFKTAEKFADQYDIQLGIHNHGGRHWLGSAAALDYVYSQTSKRVGLCMDTAWALHSHENPIQWVEKYADRLVGVHLKDFVFDKDGHHKDVVVGTGALDLPALMDALRKIDFSGFAVLEYEADVENPEPAMTKCADAVRSQA